MKYTKDTKERGLQEPLHEFSPELDRTYSIISFVYFVFFVVLLRMGFHFELVW